MSSTDETPDAMSAGDTPATSTDPALGSEGDTNQIASEDTLEHRAVDDLLDEGYSPPERPRTNHWGETHYEQAVGESLDQQLAQEQPEIWETEGQRGERQEDRAGRIEDTSDGSRQQDAFARDAGVAGGAASAEEAAMHVVDDPVAEYTRFDEDARPADRDGDGLPDDGER